MFKLYRLYNIIEVALKVDHGYFMSDARYMSLC